MAGIRIFFLSCTLVLFASNLEAAVQFLISRLDSPSFWTSERILYQASLDVERSVLILEKFTTNSQQNPKTLQWKREYPLGTQLEVDKAKVEMQKLQLEWPLDSFYQLHARNCQAIFFTIPTGPINQLANQTSQIVSRLESQNDDFGMKRLMKFTPKCGSPAFHLSAVLSADGKLKRFALVSDTTQALPLKIVQENGLILIKNNDLTLVRISESAEFNPVSGGQFSASVIVDCSKGLYKVFDFEVAPRIVRGKRVWTMTSFQELDGHIKLSTDRDPEFDVGMALVTAPVELVQGVLDGIFGTLIWNIFISGDKKKEIIESKIYSEAKKNETLTANFTDQELRRMAREIASTAQLRWFAPFSGTDDIKKRAAMTFAFELVRKTALLKLPEGSLPDMAVGVAIRVTRDLEACLRAAQDGTDIDVCVAKFGRTAPYRVGRELLRLHIEAGLKGQDLTRAEKGEVMNVALQKFDQCSQTNYFKPYDDNIRRLSGQRRRGRTTGSPDIRRSVTRGLLDDDLPFDSGKVTMSCLFEGSMEGVEHATQLSVDKALVPLMSDAGARNGKKQIVLGVLRQCLQDARFLNFAEGFKQYDNAFLQTLEVPDFQQKLNGCLSKTKVKAGEIVVEREILGNPALILATPGQPALRDNVVTMTMNEGFRPCLERQGPDKDPAKCKTMIENVATRESFTLVLQKSLREELGADTNAYRSALHAIGIDVANPRPYSFDLKKCFDDRRKTLMDLMAQGQTIPTDDFSNANCVTRAILELAPIMVRNKYLRTLDSKPDLKNVPGLKDEALIRSLGSKMRDCLFTELRGIDTVAGVAVTLEGAQERCTVALFKDVLPVVIEKTLDNKLLLIIPDAERRKALVDRLVEDFKKKIQGLDSEENIMEQVDLFIPQATLEVIRQTLRYSVEDNLPGDAERQTVVADEIIAQVITPAWEEQMRQAMAENNEGKQLKLQAQVKKNAGPLIMEKALPLRLEAHVPSAATRRTITQGVVRDYRKCLSKIKDDAQDFERRFEVCATAATVQATHSVFESSLGLALQEYFPTTGGSAAEIAGNQAAQRQVKANILTRSLWTEIGRANASGPRAVDRLGEIFKVRGAREVAVILVERELYSSLTGSVRDAVVPRAKENARQCFNQVEARLVKKESLNTQTEIEKCGRKIKVDSGLMALMESFEGSLGFLKSQRARSAAVLAKSKSFYETCTSGYQSLPKAQFESITASCLSKTVITFSRDLAEETLSYMGPIRLAPFDAMASYRTCLSNVESNISNGLTWVKSEVEKCANNVLKPKLLVEVRQFYNSTIPAGLSGGERAVAEDAFTLLSPAFDGKIVSAEGGSDPVDSLKGTFRELAEFVGESARFDQVLTQRRLTALKVKIRSRTSGTDTITEKEFVEELLKSDLMTLIIEAAIAKKIADAAGGGWLSEQARKNVVTSSNMRAVFEVSPSGISLMRAIKSEVIRPVLAGTPLDVVLGHIQTDIAVQVDRKLDEIQRALNPF